MWVRSHAAPAGALEITRHRPWASVGSIPLAGERIAWFKACRPVQGFEPRLTAELSARWPDRVVEVIAHHEPRAWLLTLDAGLPLDDLGNPPERWDELLPRYAELQRGETERAAQHLAAGVPDLRLARLPDQFEGLFAQALPLGEEEVEAGRCLGPRLRALVAELADARVGDTVDHADLHHRSVYAEGDRLRILDWGDASISHPFITLAVTFHWLREVNRLSADDAWFDRLRDAYLEPWGPGFEPAFALAQRLGLVARALAWLRHRKAMGPGTYPRFDEQWPGVLRAALGALQG